MAARAEAVPGLAELGLEVAFFTSTFAALFDALFCSDVPFWAPPLGGGDAFFVGVAARVVSSFLAALGVFLSSMKGMSAGAAVLILVVEPEQELGPSPGC